MWIMYASLFVVGYIVVRRFSVMAEEISALRVFATSLLLRPELHQANAAELRQTMLRLANDPRGVDKAVNRAMHQWAVETRARAGKAS